MSRIIRADWHIHTNLSDCGHPDAAPEAVARAAIEAGLEAIGITDHVFLPHHRARPQQARRLLSQDWNDLRIYVGCEADMQSAASSSIDAEFAASVDYVIVSTSHLFDPGVEERRIRDAKDMVDFIFELTEGAINSGLADIIAHPFSVPACPFSWEELIGRVERSRLSQTAKAAAQAGVAFEFNPRYLRWYPEATRWVYDSILEAGCKLALSSDAHHPSQVGCRGPYYATEEQVVGMGITESNLWGIGDRASGRGRRGVQ